MPEFDFDSAKNIVNSLRDPIQVFAPVKAAQEIVERSFQQFFRKKSMMRISALHLYAYYIKLHLKSTIIKQTYLFESDKPENYYPYIPLSLLFDFRDFRDFDCVNAL